MNRRNPARQVLISLSGHLKPSILDQTPELLLCREPLDTLHQILVAIAITSDNLPNQRDRAEAPLPIDSIQHGNLDLGELQARKHTTRLQHTPRLTQRRRHIREVPDAERHRVQIQRVVLDLGGYLLRVRLEEGQRGLVRGGQGEGALAADVEHGRVDVRDGDVHVGVSVVRVRVLEHAEGDVARAAGDVEDLLGLAERVRVAGVQGRDEVVPVFPLASCHCS
jgi:hypothetical protein